ncbi:hypothetical protein [Vibrio cholerae]|uniref:hypothetical protein n=1 Tax=Vibrio cholerae TaxID=666 RepID=UPI001157C6C7|nr:hypothetical protein [Vibrio cholerae]TQQ55049.1 hypothetical protein FLL62_06815 [Vibrio cholerae]
MYQTLNKQRHINDMRVRYQEIQRLLEDGRLDSKLREGLQAESQEIYRLIPLIEKYVTDVTAPDEYQAKEVVAAQKKEHEAREKTSRLLMLLIKKREQILSDLSTSKAREVELRKTLKSTNDPIAKAELQIQLGEQEVKIARLQQVGKALDFNQANAQKIALGIEKLRIVDTEALTDIAMRQRAVDSASAGTAAHDLALEALKAEEAKAEKAFFDEAGM